MIITDWIQEPLNKTATLVMGQSPDSRFYNEVGKGMPFLQGCAQFGQNSPNTGIYCSQPAKVARFGSILFSVRAPVGTINTADRDYCIGRGVAGILGKSVSTEYLRNYLLFLSADFGRVSQGSTFSAINSTELGAFLVRYPRNKVTQQKISEVLSTIDRAIDQTDALIAKYKRIKNGLMQDLLTLGIDENGNLRDPATHAFKDSPLGRIPAEWEVVQLGNERLSRRITSGSRGWASYYADHGALFVRIGNLTRLHINFRWDDVQYVKPPNNSEGSRTTLEAGDLLISITADLGIIGIVPDDLGEAYINQHIALVKLNRKNVHPPFLGNLLASHRYQLWFSEANESGAKAGLNLPTVGSTPITLPVSIDEQKAIAERLTAFDTLLAEQSAIRAKLSRTKRGLMHDLLTGDLDISPLLCEPALS